MKDQLNRAGTMSKEAQGLLNPVFAKTNSCPFCNITKLKSQYCDCPEGMAASKDQLNDKECLHDKLGNNVTCAMCGERFVSYHHPTPPTLTKRR